MTAVRQRRRESAAARAKMATQIAALVDDRWETLTTGTAANGAASAWPLDRLCGPARDIAARMVHGLDGIEGLADRLPEPDDLSIRLTERYGREREALDRLEADVARYIRKKVKAFAVATLERRAQDGVR